MSGKCTVMIMAFLLASVSTGWSQAHEISGQVTDSSTGELLVGVNVMVEGTSTGTSTNVDGEYTLSGINENAILIVSYIGYQSQRIAIEGRSSIDVSLELSAELMDELVVTALGISRERRSLGYSVGQVSGDDLATVSQENIIGGLGGRMAGVQVNQTSGVGSSISLIIRGMTSLTSDNQPLYVIDGVPVTSGLNNVTTFGDGNEVDYGNAITDLNPSDVEDMTVLKGPSAAALYGSRAANGVVLITTRQAQRGDPVRVSVSTSNVFERPFEYVDYHYQYASGNRNAFLDESSSYWAGPELDVGNTAVQWNSPLDDNGNRVPTELRSYPDNMKNFLNTGVTSNNNITITGSTENTVYKLSANNMFHNGMIPNSDLHRNAVSTALTRDILENLSVSMNINYSRSNSDNRPSTQDRRANPLEAVYFAPHVNVMELRDYWEPGQEGIQQRSYASGQDNPWFLAYGINNSFLRNRVFGNVRADWDILPNLSMFARVSLNSSSENRESKIPWSYSRMARGGYFLQELANDEINTDFLITYQNQTDDFDFSLSGGGNYMENSYRDVYNGVNNANRNDGLSVPGLYTVSNIPINSLDARNFSSLKKIYSLYATASIGFRYQLYLDVSGRNDWSSTLPANNRSYFYPSVSLSWLANETFSLPSDINMLKFRFGWAQVGNDTNPYQLQQTLSVGTIPGMGIPTATIPGQMLNPQLKPEIATSFEGGIDLNMFENRVRFEATYYQVENKNQILRLGTPSSSGASSRLINAGMLESEGWEIAIGGTPVLTNNLSWDVNMNFTRNRTRLIELSDDFDRIEFWGENGAGAYTHVGEEVGNMYSRGYARVEDPNSEYHGWPIVDSGGQWIRLDDPEDWIKVGNFNPDLLVGGQSTLQYKRWSLSASIDWRIGGEFMSSTYRYGGSNWKDANQMRNLIPGGHYSEEELIELLKSDPDAYIIPRNGHFPRVGGYTQEAGGMYVDEGGVTGYDGVFIPGVRVDPETGEYIEHLGGEGTIVRPASNMFAWRFNQQVIFDADFIKLRELALGYDVPAFMGINNLRVSVFTRNLLLWTKAGIGIDPERAFQAQGSTQGDTAMLFRMGTERQNIMPFSTSFGFNINLNF
ncbi:MAG: SusC/RagA family TonB-linked outer membrane protein [Balneolaceae bacterium]|nr:SusC/RagA family TonB-linked outer membrane protein [Balneolaceae bacterium]